MSTPGPSKDLGEVLEAQTVTRLYTNVLGANWYPYIKDLMEDAWDIWPESLLSMFFT